MTLSNSLSGKLTVDVIICRVSGFQWVGRKSRVIEKKRTMPRNFIWSAEKNSRHRAGEPGRSHQIRRLEVRPMMLVFVYEKGEVEG